MLLRAKKEVFLLDFDWIFNKELSFLPASSSVQRCGSCVTAFLGPEEQGGYLTSPLFQYLCSLTPSSPGKYT